MPGDAHGNRAPRHQSPTKPPCRGCAPPACLVPTEPRSLESRSERNVRNVVLACDSIRSIAKRLGPRARNGSAPLRGKHAMRRAAHARLPAPPAIEAHTDTSGRRISVPQSQIPEPALTRSLPRNLRIEEFAVMTAHTVWLPTSSGPVSQHPLRKNPVIGFREHTSSVSPSTFLASLGRPPPPLPEPSPHRRCSHIGNSPARQSWHSRSPEHLNQSENKPRSSVSGRKSAPTIADKRAISTGYQSPE